MLDGNLRRLLFVCGLLACMMVVVWKTVNHGLRSLVASAPGMIQRADRSISSFGRFLRIEPGFPNPTIVVIGDTIPSQVPVDTAGIEYTVHARIGTALPLRNILRLAPHTHMALGRTSNSATVVVNDGLVRFVWPGVARVCADTDSGTRCALAVTER